MEWLLRRKQNNDILRVMHDGRNPLIAMLFLGGGKCKPADWRGLHAYSVKEILRFAHYDDKRKGGKL